ncbi:MAG TPA: peptidylprolyl isomerase [Xanthomonadaceae bacterium]|nr:peptidylprolyl isomerase [Xanthomonadaceae bacterium]
MSRTFVALLLLGLAGCEARQEPAAGPQRALSGAPEGATVATVGGEAISEPLLDAFARQSGLDLDDPAQREQALGALVNSVLWAQAALQRPALETEAWRAEAALARTLQLATHELAAFREEVAIDEARLQAYYRQEVERAGPVQYRLQHILFAEETAARAVVELARQPEADFEALMAQYAESAQQARTLDFADATQLPPELVEAARQLADGEVAPVPIRTRFGWHVLRRLETRAFEPPPFESVREGARRQLLDRAVTDRLSALREAARVGTGDDARVD